MKLSENALAVLKNFANINSGVVLRAGNVQKTMHPDQVILVEAKLEDSMPNSFGIYDLNQFLGNLTTLKNPDLAFTPDSVVMTDGDLALTYRGCSPSLIIAPPDKELVLPKVDVKFVLKNEVLSKLLRLASMNNLTHLSVIGKNGELRLQTHELKSDTSNYASIKVDAYDGPDCNVAFKTENLLLIPDDYDVEIAIGGFARFVNKAGNLTYFVAIDKVKK